MFNFIGLKFRLMRLFKIRNPTQSGFVQDEVNQVHLFYCTMQGLYALVFGNALFFSSLKAFLDAYMSDSEDFSCTALIELTLFFGCQWYSVFGALYLQVYFGVETDGVLSPCR
jgi:hypothetical protein